MSEPDPDPTRPLGGPVIGDLSQFLAGRCYSLRLSDPGARVIRIMRPGGGDLTRRPCLSAREIGGDCTPLQAIDRGRDSLALDLQSPRRSGSAAANAGPGRCADPELSPRRDRARARGPTRCAADRRPIQASISGHGEDGPAVDRPGKDLLAQARSGLMWLNGDAGQGPVPHGPAIGDIRARAACAQGILAAPVRCGIGGQSADVQTSLPEASIELQVKVLTGYLNDGRRPPQRAAQGSAQANLAQPCGVHAAQDGYLVIAMTPVAPAGRSDRRNRAGPLARPARTLVHRPRPDQGAGGGAGGGPDGERMARGAEARRYLVRPRAGLARPADQPPVSPRCTCCRQWRAPMAWPCRPPHARLRCDSMRPANALGAPTIGAQSAAIGADCAPWPALPQPPDRPRIAVPDLIRLGL